MPRQRPRILTAVAAVAAVAALAGAAVISMPARATPPSPDVSTTILARSLFDRIQVRAHADTADRWRALLKTHGQSDVNVVDNKLPPGATTGWHSHPGPSLILVVAGSVTNYPAADPRCRPRVYPAGSTPRLPATVPPSGRASRRTSGQATVTTSFPWACPSPRWRRASAASVSG